MELRQIQQVMAENKSTHFYNDQLRDIFGKANTVNINEQHQAKLTYAYALLLVSKNPDVTFAEVMTHAEQKREYLEQNGFAVSTVSTKEEPTEVNKKKGWKAIKAKELYLQNRKEFSRKQFIELFMKEVEMTKAGASTYHANLKKQYGS